MKLGLKKTFKVASKDEIISSSIDVFKNSIRDNLYGELSAKRKKKKLIKMADKERELIARSKRINKKQKKNSSKTEPAFKENKLVLNIKENNTMTKIIEYFYELANNQGKKIEISDFERNIPRLLLSKKKSNGIFDNISKRYEVNLPQKGRKGWEYIRNLMSTANEFGWSKKEHHNKLEKDILTKKENPARLIGIRSQDEKISTKEALCNEIEKKDLFSFNDFKKSIESNEGFSTNEKAFKNFQKEFKNGEQKKVLLSIIRKGLKVDTNRSTKNIYYKLIFKSEGWRICAKGDKIVELFYRDHDKYLIDLNNKF